jgi:hypothetical protein
MAPEDRAQQHEDQLTLLITLNVKLVTAIESLAVSLATLTHLLQRLTQDKP